MASWLMRMVSSSGKSSLQPARDLLRAPGLRPSSVLPVPDLPPHLPHVTLGPRISVPLGAVIAHHPDGALTHLGENFGIWYGSSWLQSLKSWSLRILGAVQSGKARETERTNNGQEHDLPLVR